MSSIWRIPFSSPLRRQILKPFLPNSFPRSLGFAFLLAVASTVTALGQPTETDLVTPEMTLEEPAAGRRVRQVAREYAGTAVYHALYLPVNWEPGGRYSVLVEYTGNQFAPTGSTGEVKDANLGYGLTGGRDFIWVTMPCIETGGRENALRWWGDREATIDYCKKNLSRICAQFGGDPESVFICGFSRGAIAASYIGLADNAIASFWKGMMTHDHFDGEQSWDYPESDRAAALARLARLKGRPVLGCGQGNDFLQEHLELAEFTFLRPPVAKLFDIPRERSSIRIPTCGCIVKANIAIAPASGSPYTNSGYATSTEEVSTGAISIEGSEVRMTYDLSMIRFSF